MQQLKKLINNLLLAFKYSFLEFSDTKIPQKSASLSYYTIFAIAPVIYLVVQLIGIFYGDDAVSGQVFSYLTGYMGPEMATQIQDLIKNIQFDRTTNDTSFFDYISIASLIFTATGVFVEIQDSINDIWHLKAKPQKGWLDFIVNRLLSFSIIVSIGFIMLTSLLINAFIDVFIDKLIVYFPDQTVYVSLAINNAIVILVVTVMFYTVFSVLPDGKVDPKATRIGAFLTTLLFLAGKWGIGVYLGNSKVGTTFGSSSTLVILMLWVYYSSFLLFFGALFTRVYSTVTDRPIKPKKETVYVEEKETLINPETLKYLRAKFENKTSEEA